MSVHYEFPYIENIDDIFPHLDDKSFSVKAKDCGLTYINYLRMGSETFPPVMGTEPERLRARMRREGRGIAFNTKTGELVSRPFHKFFNVGEAEDLSYEHLGFHRPHVVMDKLDGSLLRPLPTEFGLRWGTKAGITDVGNLAEKWIDDHAKFRKIALTCMAANQTPIFEFVSPENRIVARYNEPDMVLLAVRDNLTGLYMDYDNLVLMAQDFGVSVVRQFDPVEGDPAAYFDTLRASDDLDEGIVIAWPNGHRAKAKTDLYTTLHHIKEKASTERNLIRAIFTQDIDDLLPLVPEKDSEAIRAFVDEFWHWMDSLIQDIKDIYAQATSEYETKKDFAIGTKDTWPHIARSIVFTKWDKKVGTSRELAEQMVQNALTSETKWAEFRESLGGATRITKPTMKWEAKEDTE
jgi:RNA ligase